MGGSGSVLTLSPMQSRNTAVFFEGKQRRAEGVTAALILQGRMCCSKVLDDSENYLEAAQLRGKISSESSGWTVPTSLCTQ